VAASVLGPDGGTCVKKTCDDYRAEGKDCGQQSDGCGGIIDCGGCTPPAFCGGGGPSKCAPAGGNPCVKKTCADYPGKCGPQPDGCGGVTENCGTCAPPQICGGGGVPSVCGGGVVSGPDGGTCDPIKTCGPKQCGKIADGCGGILDCGTANCGDGEVCGGAGVENECGKPPCTPLTACPLNMNCGSIADGCGGLVACGSPNACTPPAICGGGGQPNVCGGGSVVADGGGPCNPITACLPNQCGPIADGCGGILDCGTCANGMPCGGGGTPSVCPGTCTPRTQADCATLGFNCGYIADGCGGPPIQCGATCPNGGICGLDSPNVCSASNPNCTNLCLDRPTDCPGGTNTTTITGTVYMPNGTLPVYDALVYVPNGPLDPMPTGIGSCDTCSAQVSGQPLEVVHTNARGEFTLTNMPHRAGGVPLVIQKGRWRKLITVTTNRCGTRALPKQDTTFGSTHSPTNNIPKFAVTTGGADALQCLLRKIGIADSEFTLPSGPGRVNIYAGSGGTSRFTENHANNYTGRNRNLPSELTLYGDDNGGNPGVVDTDRLFRYDAVVLTCTGQGGDRENDLAPYRAEMKAYADAGGKIFASHWHHSWLEYGPSPWGGRNNPPPPPLQPIATINHLADLNSVTGTINTSFPKGQALSEWLQASGSTAAPGTINITGAQHTITAVDTTRATPWITVGQNSVQYFDFNTPVGQATQCGRFVISDLHVSRDSTTQDFPAGCSSTGMTDQEKVLAFMLFDLTSCVEQPQPKTCKPLKCADYPPGTCGEQSDGCGGKTANCGTCPAGQTCGGGGVPSQCGAPSACVPKRCADYNASCGQVPDGCGRLLDCGTCPAGQTCGGGGVANQCGAPTCTPKTCAELGIGCGPAGDGCGNIIDCGTCPAGQTCGGGGVQNQCGAPACTPLTACPPGKNCGEMPDGCGGVINCGTCPNGQTCGGGGAPNVCGAASCSPKRCEDVGAQCGVISDRCGGTVTCGTCAPGSFCNEDNLCVPPVCQPKTCQQLGAECGRVADGCGGLTPDCGKCPPDTVCGGGGIPNKCGKNPCTPATCAQLEAECGRVADGCGGLTPDCGTCKGSTSCSNGKCVDACKPRTCQEAGAQCGPIADGCGGIIDCGPCPPGQECGYNNQPNICGSAAPK
jgi:hypothetical protein